MTSPFADGIDRLRQPEYTGENRCLPCTVVNLMLGGFLAILVATAGVRNGVEGAGVLVGGVVFLLSAAAIYFRGYLVPGTPRLTKTYFPDWLLAMFDKRPEVGSTDQSFDAEATLLRAGAVEECERVDDLCLTPDFRDAWFDRMDEIRADGFDPDAAGDDLPREDLATFLDIDPGQLAFQTHDHAFVARNGPHRVGQWESSAAFVADMAAARVLRERYPGWQDLDPQHRSAALHGLRLFLERCPDCGEAVTPDREVVESCCRSVDVVAVTCEGCDVRLFESEVTQ